MATSNKVDELLKMIEDNKKIIEENNEMIEELRNPDYAYCVDCDNIITTEKKDDNAVWISGEIWVCGKCMKHKISEGW